MSIFLTVHFFPQRGPKGIQYVPHVFVNTFYSPQSFDFLLHHQTQALAYGLTHLRFPGRPIQL